MISFFRKLFWLTNRGKKEAELREELEFHLEEEAEQLQQMGLPKEEARRTARLELGNPTSVAENTREAWSWTAVEQLKRDVSHACRLMRRSPAFTTTAVLSLALGIGANTAIFSLFDTIVLRPLPIAHPENLVEFLENDPGQPRQSSSLASFPFRSNFRLTAKRKRRQHSLGELVWKRLSHDAGGTFDFSGCRGCHFSQSFVSAAKLQPWLSP